MDTRLNINAILDGSIPLSKLAEKVSNGPYIWDGTTSETIYNEIIDCIVNGRTIMYNRIDTNDDGLYHICISSAIGSQIAYLTFSDTYRHGAFKMLITKDQVLRVQGFIPFFSSNSGASILLEAGTYSSINIDTNTEIIYDSTINGIQQYYEGEFIFGDVAYTITFPDIITWITIPESYKPNTTYQFEITNNIGKLWEVGNGEIAYKSDIPTKVSDLEDDLSIVTLNDSTPIVESLVGDELIPIKQNGENKTVSAADLVKGAKEVYTIDISEYSANDFEKLTQAIIDCKIILIYDQGAYSIFTPYFINNVNINGIIIYYFPNSTDNGNIETLKVQPIVIGFTSDGNISTGDGIIDFEFAGDGTKYLSDDGSYKEIVVPTKVSDLENDLSIATTTTPGLMSAEDKTKLDQVTAANTSIVTQAEYDALVSAGAATSGTVYYIRG